MENTKSYIEQRLAAMGKSTPVMEKDSEMAKLREENARLKEMLNSAPPVNLVTEAQRAFEQSPEFEQIHNIFLARYLRSRFGQEFRQSPFWTDFQAAASAAFSEFEKKGVKSNGQAGKKDS